VNCGGVETLGTVPFLVDVAALLDSPLNDVVVGLSGALLTPGNEEENTGVEVGGATEPSVGVPACVGVASVSVLLSCSNALLAATSLIAVRLTVVKYVVRVEVS
jgi:hypothetical protein